MQFVPHLHFNGQCEAFKLYEKCLGGKILNLSSYAGTPSNRTCPPTGATKSCTPLSLSAISF